MIAFLKGTLAGKALAQAYIDVNGVGFAVGMASSSIAKLPDVGERVEIHTYLQVRDDGMALYGFLTMEEKAMFERLIGVSSVGPKIALAALSLYSPSQLAGAIAAQDTARISKVPGIGKKMAQRIILELKGTLEAEGSLFATDISSDASSAAGGPRDGAYEALLSMGFTSAEADLALKGAPADGTETALLQYALKRLGSA